MIKATLMSGLRRIRDAASRRGLTLRTVRGREQWRAGVELLWRDVEHGQERVTISDVLFDNHRVKMLVRNRDDWIQSHHCRGVPFAADELRQIGKLYRGKTFVDVGANVGNHSIIAATAFGAPRVIAFEPNPAAAQILIANIGLNNLSTVITHHAVGLSDSNGTASAVSPETGLNLGGTKLVSGVGDLVLRRGDDLLGGEDIGFIKIDVEGAEMQVLAGLEETIRPTRPPMLVEVDDDNVEAFHAWIERFDYRVEARARPGAGNEDYFLVAR